MSVYSQVDRTSIHQSILNKHWHALINLPCTSVHCPFLSKWLATASNSMQHATKNTNLWLKGSNTVACYRSHIVPFSAIYTCANICKFTCLQKPLISGWFITHISKMIMVTPHCLSVDVSSGYYDDWMIAHTIILQHPVSCHLLVHVSIPLCMHWCVVRLFLRLNDFLHKPQQNGRSPVCMFRCLFMSFCHLNDLLQMSQQNGRSSLWIRWCVFRLSLRVNDLLHKSQQNNCSPLCLRLCAFRSSLRQNELVHMSQQYGRSPLCTRWCVFKISLRLNDILQMSQQNGRSPVCMLRCDFRTWGHLNDLLQMSQ
jgi:hypothetical protein